MYSSLKFLLGSVKRRIILANKQAKWRKMNMHNQTNPVNIFPLAKVKVGRYTYGDLRVYCYRNPNESLTIGDFCSIASDVIFILGGEHNYRKITSFPMEEKFGGKYCESTTKGPIIVEDDVWIGDRCTILSGVTIGKGSIIAAGSLVFKSIPPYSIYAGGRIVKKRFADEDLCKEMESFDFSKIDKNTILNDYVLFNEELSMNNLKKIKGIIKYDNSDERND